MSDDPDNKRNLSVQVLFLEIEETLPQRFQITAWTTSDDEIMGIADEPMRMYGMQYHPESILTKVGMDLLRNFLEVS